MKLATYLDAHGEHIGVVVGDGIVSIARHIPAAPARMIDLIARWEEFRDLLAPLQSGTPDVRLDQVRLRAPVPRPGKIMAIGLNYLDHVTETQLKVPEHQLWFSKAPTSVTGPFDPIALPAVSNVLDYEAEMVAVIGRKVRGVSGAAAKDAIFGYCVGNDVSVRDWQTRVTQWVLGKSFDTHAPFGPWITTADEVDAHSLGIRCKVNGQELQAANTSQMLFNCFDQVEHLSQVMTLEPGDVIFTGTPSGVGFARDPQILLRDGDIVRVEIDGLGAIENRVKAEPATGFPA